MTIIEGLTAIGVLGGFFWMILAQLAAKNPKVDEWLKSMWASKPKTPITEGEYFQQIHPEKRQIM